ncbi:NADPH:quinone oxidoreductase family protein [Spongiibacter sp.]|uniref:NADPH:quinone oxidoreductase family protein n=1 Tax=Spongiibacter sp. TaxID=2024860 RepID=UPI0035670605
MRAIVCTEYGSPDSLSLQELAEPPLQAGQVRVAVKAAGVNFVDSLLVAGSYQIKIPPPFTPGGDIAGVVSEIGDGVEHFAVGDRVLGSPGIGGFAESVVLTAEQLTAIPDGMGDDAAATFVQAHATAYYALVNRGQLLAGETLLVLGAAGGTGIAAIHVAKALGARVIAAASSEQKLAACIAAGADATINYSEQDLKTQAKQLSGGKGVDLVFDPVGGDYSEAALRACAPGARFLVVGFAAGDIPRIPLNLVLLKKCQIVGVDWGGSVLLDLPLYQRVCDEIIALYQQGKLPDPPFSHYALADTGRALADLQQRKVAGKAVVLPGQ